MTTDEKFQHAARLVAQAFVDTVRDLHPLPCPSGPMYAAFMAAGGDIESYTKITDALVKIGRLEKTGNHCFVLGPKELQ